MFSKKYAKKYFLFGFFILFVCILIFVSIRMKQGNDPHLSNASVKERIDTLSKAESQDTVNPRSVNPASYDNGMSSQMRNLEKAQSKISRQIRAIESEMEAIKGAIQSSVDERDNMPFEKKNPEEELREEEEKTMAEIRRDIDLMDNTIAAESVDKEWSDFALQSAYNTFQQDDLHSFTISEIECKSTICRIALQSSSVSPEESFNTLSEHRPWNGEMFFRIDDINSGEAIIYISREGYSLPQNVPSNMRE